MSGRRLLALSLSLAALIGAWAYQSPARATYAIGVEQALARSTTTPDARMRVSGYLVPGSLSRGRPCGGHFRLSSAPGTSPAAELRVELDGCLPEVLCDLPGVDSGLAVEGRFRRETGAPVFVASLLVAKCSGKYVVPDLRGACARASADERRACPYCGHGLQSAGGLPAN
jgi:cytochrome c-type biogenesis protein CcmE